MPLVAFAAMLFPSPVGAAPSQADVFKSIQDNVGGGAGVDFNKVLPFVLAGGGLLILLALFSQRRSREVAPRALNHSGKLLKEVGKAVPLRPVEWKQLKVLAEDNPRGDGPMVSPLTLLLCPSVLAKSIQARQAKPGKGKVDRKALAAVARKAGVTKEMLAGK